MTDEILDVDLLAFESGSAVQRRAVVDGVTRSLATGFVYTSHDVSDDLLDTAYGMLREFFEKSPEEIRYPAMSELDVALGDDGEPGHVWAGAHADINLITALPRS